jgi:16S rRNA (guanine527-N7)-methyltransferase
MTTEICPARIQAGMNSTRISELLEPFLRSPGERPSDAVLAKISTYIDLLVRWNARVNLTAIHDPDEIVTRHFGESLFAARYLFPSPGGAAARIETPVGLGRIRLADVGSGAGFPGVPIKLWEPEISLTLIESNQKKAAFLREVCRALALEQVNVENVRAETISSGAFDMVTLRAVERFSQALAATANLVRPCGRLALLISSRQTGVARAALSNFHWSEPNSIPMSNSRLLLVGTKEP